MYPIIYDVAVSLDGFISGPSGDISQFANEGRVVDDYFTRLSTYKIALMGRKTYEFGYDFGLEPGRNPYSHMRSIIFSDTLGFTEGADVEIQKRPTPEFIRQLARDADGPIYLCGGGKFAGWMLEHRLIDRLILKRAPCVLGGGIPLFNGDLRPTTLVRTNTKTYENGYLLEEFSIC